MTITRRAQLGLIGLLALIVTSCGYHTAGKASRIPTDVKTLAVPAFVNQTQTYRIEAVLTEAVVREFNTRTKYLIVYRPDADADAVLPRNRDWHTVGASDLRFEHRASLEAPWYCEPESSPHHEERALCCTRIHNYVYPRAVPDLPANSLSFFEEQGSGGAPVVAGLRANAGDSTVLEMY